jgi:hypothetical protein
MNKISPHKDEKLNLLRWLALGMAGVYLYQVNRKEGSLSGASEKIKSININTDKIVDSITPWINIPEHQKQFVSDGLKEFIRNVKNEFNKD